MAVTGASSYLVVGAGSGPTDWPLFTHPLLIWTFGYGNLENSKCWKSVFLDRFWWFEGPGVSKSNTAYFFTPGGIFWRSGELWRAPEVLAARFRSGSMVWRILSTRVTAVVCRCFCGFGCWKGGFCPTFIDNLVEKGAKRHQHGVKRVPKWAKGLSKTHNELPKAPIADQGRKN